MRIRRSKEKGCAVCNGPAGLHTLPVLNKQAILCYPLAHEHGNGKSPFSIGNTSSEGQFSIAMLVYQRVCWNNWKLCPPNWYFLHHSPVATQNQESFVPHIEGSHTNSNLYFTANFQIYSLLSSKGCFFGGVFQFNMLAHNLSSWLFKNGILIMCTCSSPNKSPNQQNGAPFFSLLSCHQVHCSCELCELCAGLSALLRQQLPLLPDEPGGTGNAAGGKEETTGRHFFVAHIHMLFLSWQKEALKICVDIRLFALQLWFKNILYVVFTVFLLNLLSKTMNDKMHP